MNVKVIKENEILCFHRVEGYKIDTRIGVVKLYLDERIYEMDSYVIDDVEKFIVENVLVWSR